MGPKDPPHRLATPRILTRGLMQSSNTSYSPRQVDRIWVYGDPLNWINVRDPLYFLGYGIPYIYVKRILFFS